MMRTKSRTCSCGAPPPSFYDGGSEGGAGRAGRGGGGRAERLLHRSGIGISNNNDGSRFKSAFGTGESLPPSSDVVGGKSPSSSLVASSGASAGGGGSGGGRVIEGISRSITRSSHGSEEDSGAVVHDGSSSSRRISSSSHSSGGGRKNSTSSSCSVPSIISESSSADAAEDGVEEGGKDASSSASSSFRASDFVPAGEEEESGRTTRRRRSAMTLGRLKFESLPLFGRDEDIARLREAYRRCRRHRRRRRSTGDDDEGSNGIAPGAEDDANEDKEGTKDDLREVCSSTHEDDGDEEGTVATDDDGSRSEESEEASLSTKRHPDAPGLLVAAGGGPSSLNLSQRGPPPPALESSTRGKKSAAPPPTRELVLVSGPSGSGKSSLVSAALSSEYVVRRTTTTSSGLGGGGGGGLVARGKFDARRRVGVGASSAPYGGLSAALGELCDELLLLRASEEEEEKKERDDPTSSSTASEEEKKEEEEQNDDALSRLVGPDLRDALDGVVGRGKQRNGRRNSSLRCDADADASSSLSPSPSLESLSSSSSSMADYDEGVRGRARTTAAARKLVRSACSSLAGPSGGGGVVVLALDDLQWADDDSLALIEALLTDRDTEGLLVVGTYRDDEVETGKDDDGGGLSGWLGRMANHEGRGLVGVERLDVGNLTVDDSAALLSELLSISDDDEKSTSSSGGEEGRAMTPVRSLATVLHRKTHGNPFHLVQFLQSLRDDGALSYNLGTFRWTWDLHAIEARSVTENVADLLAAKMRGRLSPGAGRVLSVGSCLGTSFDLATLTLIAESMEESAFLVDADAADDDGGEGSDIERLVRDCVAEGFLEEERREEKEEEGKGGRTHPPHAPPSSSSSFRFAHDQISDAAFRLLPEDERERLQSRIGEVLLEKLSPDELDGMIFVVVDLLNRGHFSTTDDDDDGWDEGKKTELARLNLRAGKRAAEVSAFAAAESYLKTGVGLLPSAPSTRWAAEPDKTLALELYSSTAEAQFCAGRFARMKKTAYAVLARDDLSWADKFRCRYVLACCLKSTNKLPEAVKLARTVLSEKGVTFPKFGLKGAIALDLCKTKKLLSGQTARSLRDLPLAESRERAMTMAMMSVLADCAYFIEPDLFPVVALKMLRDSVKHGVSAHSCYGFGTYAIVLSSLFKDYAGAYEFGQITSDVMKKTNARDLESKMLVLLHTFVNHWVLNQHLSLKPLCDGHRIGMLTGKIEDAGFCTNMYVNLSLYSGKALNGLEPDLARRIAEMEEHNQDLVVVFMRISRQFCQSLMGRAVDCTAMDGEVMRYEEALGEATKRGNLCIHNTVKMYRMWLAYYFGDYDLAWRMYSECPTLEKRLYGTFTFCRVVFFKGLAALALARRHNNGGGGGFARGKWRRRAAAAISQVEEFVKKGSINCIHMVHLFRAERASLRNENGDAEKHYENAISTAGRYGFLQDKALCCERAGEHFLARGDEYWAKVHLSNAHKHYLEWGAWAKTKQLRQRHASLDIA